MPAVTFHSKNHPPLIRFQFSLVRIITSLSQRNLNAFLVKLDNVKRDITEMISSEKQVQIKAAQQKARQLQIALDAPKKHPVTKGRPHFEQTVPESNNELLIDPVRGQRVTSRAHIDVGREQGMPLLSGIIVVDVRIKSSDIYENQTTCQFMPVLYSSEDNYKSFPSFYQRQCVLHIDTTELHRPCLVFKSNIRVVLSVQQVAKRNSKDGQANGASDKFIPISENDV